MYRGRQHVQFIHGTGAEASWPAVSSRRRLSCPVVGSALLAMADQGVDSLLERRMGHEQAPEAGPG